MKTGILGYGIYVPRERIQSELILKDREKDADESVLDRLVSRLRYGLLVKNKAIASINEDSATLGYEATINALRMSGVDPKDIGLIVFGSESKPYAVKTTATQIGSWAGLGKRKYAFDIECACNAGIQAISVAKAYVGSGSVDFGIGVGGDISGAAPKDDLEYSVGAGGVAGVVGKGTEDELIGLLYPGSPYSSDYADFFRREGEEHPRHFGPTTGAAYVEHVCGAAIGLLEMYPKICLSDFPYMALHAPNGYMPKKALRSFSQEEIEKIMAKPEEKRGPADKASLKIAEYLQATGLEERARLTREDIDDKLNLRPVLEFGNTYAPQTGIALSDILDSAKPHENVLVISYGSGAGAIATIFETLPGLENKRGLVPTVQDYVDRMVDTRLDTYKKLFKERMKRWTAKHLVFRKLVGEIEPAEDNDGFHKISICKECDAIYTPERTCLNHNHSIDDMVYLKLPKKAILKKSSTHSLAKSFRERASEVILQGKVILADCDKEELYEGMGLEPTIRRLDHEGKDGLIHYGWAYRPLFGNSEKYLSRLKERELTEIPPLVH